MMNALVRHSTLVHSGMIGKALNTNITIKQRYKSQNSVAILENDHDTDSLFLI